MTREVWSMILQVAMPLVTGIVVPWAIMAYQRRTNVQITDQRRAAIMGAFTTAAGIIQTKLDQGLLKVSDITASNPTIMAESTAALERVPVAAAAEKTTPYAGAAIIVGRVDTSQKELLTA